MRFRGARTTSTSAPIAPGRVTAPIVGGNLYTLNHLMGTPVRARPVRVHRVLEEVDLMAIDFDVMFWQMRLAGMFDNVAGFVVSDLHGCGKPDPEVVADRSLEDVLETAPGVARSTGDLRVCRSGTDRTSRPSRSGSWPLWTPTPAPSRSTSLASADEDRILRVGHGVALVLASLRKGTGTWRSLVAHLTGGQGVAGSNPVVPTVFVQVRAGAALRGRARSVVSVASMQQRGGRPPSHAATTVTQWVNSTGAEQPPRGGRESLGAGARTLERLEAP